MNLKVLNLEHNNLKALNVDNLKNLQVLYLLDNPFTTTPLMIGYMPNLRSLEIAQCGNVSPNFTLRNYPKLQSFDAYYCHSLKQVDPTACPDLVQLSLDMTNVSSVDVTQNANLKILNVSDTYVHTLDVSKNTKLTELYISYSSGSLGDDVKFETIDVTHNPELYYFFCSDNKLKELDLSKNPKLFNLSCGNNLFTSIDLSNNPNLYIVSLSNNNMDFATLPKNPGTWNQYDYRQNDLPVNSTYKVGDVIDLSSHVLRTGTSTNGVLCSVKKDDPTNYTVLDDSYYTYEKGKVTLLKEVPLDKVFIQFTNSELSNYSLDTERFNIRSAADYGKDEKAVDISSPAAEGTNCTLSNKSAQLGPQLSLGV